MIPAVMALLAPRPSEAVLDVACGQGVLAPALANAKALYTGVEAAPKLIQLALKRHAQVGRFLTGDARQLDRVKGLHPQSFDAAVVMLALQDMDPVEEVFRSLAWAVKPGGRVVIAMTHPCFRIPRQSGWGWDAQRKLQYRRVDRYLTPLAVPMRATAGGRTSYTTSFHRPLHTYINGLAAHGFAVDAMKELPLARGRGAGPRARAEQAAAQEIPQFLALRALKPL